MIAPPRRALPRASRCLLAGCIGMALAVGACSKSGSRGRGSAPSDASAGAADALMPEAETREVLLLFASAEDDRLRAERRQLPWNPSVEEQARQAVLALIAGPEGDLLPVLPSGSALRELYVMKDGTAVVDLSMPSAAAGSEAEFAAIYAVVDTLALNFPEIHRVGFLIEGEERETLFGHLDARYPFAPSTAPLQAALAARLRAILAERGEAPLEGPAQGSAPATPGPPGLRPGLRPGPAPLSPDLPGQHGARPSAGSATR